MFVPLTQKIIDNHSWTVTATHFNAELSTVLYELGYMHKWGINNDDGFILAVKQEKLSDEFYRPTIYIFKADDVFNRGNFHFQGIEVEGGDPEDKVVVKSNMGDITLEDLVNFGGGRTPVIPHMVSGTRDAAEMDFINERTHIGGPNYSQHYWTMGSTVHHDWTVFTSVNGGEFPPSWQAKVPEIMGNYRAAQRYAAIVKEYYSDTEGRKAAERCFTHTAFVQNGSKYALMLNTEGNQNDYYIYRNLESAKTGDLFPESIITSLDNKDVMRGPMIGSANNTQMCLNVLLEKRGFLNCMTWPAQATTYGYACLIGFLMEITFPGDVVFITASLHGGCVHRDVGWYYAFGCSVNTYGEDPAKFGYQKGFVWKQRDLAYLTVENSLSSFCPGVNVIFHVQACHGILPNDKHLVIQSGSEATSAHEASKARTLEETVFSILPDYHIDQTVFHGDTMSVAVYTVQDMWNAGVPEPYSEFGAHQVNKIFKLTAPIGNKKWVWFSATQPNEIGHTFNFAITQVGSTYQVKEKNAPGGFFYFGTVDFIEHNQSESCTIDDFVYFVTEYVKREEKEFKDKLIAYRDWCNATGVDPVFDLYDKKSDVPEGSDVYEDRGIIVLETIHSTPTHKTGGDADVLKAKF